jgi:hypothetical protein
MLSRFQHATLKYVAQAPCPVLVVHSRDDEIIPFHHGEALHAAGADSDLLVLDGDHNTGFLRDEATYRAGLDAFLTGLGLPQPR